jgi:hypothetical protein
MGQQGFYCSFCSNLDKAKKAFQVLMHVWWATWKGLVVLAFGGPTKDNQFFKSRE